MDLLAEHIEAGSSPPLLPDEIVTNQANALLAAIGNNTEAAIDAIPDGFALIRAAPSHLGAQLVAAQILERARLRDDMLDTWAALARRYPDSHLALRFWMRWLARAGRGEEAVTLLEERVSIAEEAGLETKPLAELCTELKDGPSSDRLFKRLIALDPDNIQIRVLYGKALFGRGDVVAAFDVLDPLRAERLSPTARQLVDRNDRAILAMETIAENASFGPPGGSNILRTAILSFQRRVPRALPTDAIGGITFYTGSLGPGGAEGQISKLAVAFKEREDALRNIHGTRIAGPVRLIVNSVDPAIKKDFFRPRIDAAGIPLQVAQALPETPLSEIAEGSPALQELLPMLPRNAQFGIERLTAELRETAPDIFYIWQDGAVLTGALAALLAGVPQIRISLRGLPPSMRPHLMKPEYLDMYQALSEIPGIKLSCNSSVAATAYAEWTGIPRERFSVLYNAISPGDATATDAESRALWEAFDQSTSDANLTLGSVFRFTPNKRGLLWIDWAAAALERYPNLRFILVGDGVEREAAEARARAKRIDHRILFTGTSSFVPFWLEKMDILSLLSENEGLPNTLIEAQIAGLPVISTPAGGAAETMLHGRTGYILSSAAEPSRDEFLMFLDLILTGKPGLENMSAQAATYARAKFDLDHILTQSVRFFHGETIAGDQETTATRKITPFGREQGAISTYQQIGQSDGPKARDRAV